MTLQWPDSIATYIRAKWHQCLGARQLWGDIGSYLTNCQNKFTFGYCPSRTVSNVIQFYKPNSLPLGQIGSSPTTEEIQTQSIG